MEIKVLDLNGTILLNNIISLFMIDQNKIKDIKLMIACLV